MSVQVKRRRESATFLASYAGAQGELIIDTTNNRVQVHDGATAGGFAAAKLSEVLQSTNNLSDLPNKAAALANLGAIASSEAGAVNGVAVLDSAGLLPPRSLPSLAGDVTSISGSAVTTIAANAVTNAKAAQMAAGTLKGNNTGSTANAIDLTGSQAAAILPALVGDTGTGGTKGLVPAPGSGSAANNEVLGAGGTWVAQMAGFRNRLRNGSFAINQRAVSGTVTLAAGAYGHDGVKAGSSGATYTFAASGIDTTITISVGSLIMPVESGLIEGGTYTLSQAGTAQARVWQGTGYAGSGAYAAAPLTVTGLTAATQTNVEFSTGTVLRPQIEPGLAATPFERRPPCIELCLCQRHLFVCAPGAANVNVGMGQTVNSGQAEILFEPPVPMYAVPTLSISAAGDFALQLSGSSVAAMTAFIAAGTNTNALLTCLATTSSSFSSALFVILRTTNANARYTLSAEL